MKRIKEDDIVILQPKTETEMRLFNALGVVIQFYENVMSFDTGMINENIERLCIFDNGNSSLMIQKIEEGFVYFIEKRKDDDAVLFLESGNILNLFEKFLTDNSLKSSDSRRLLELAKDTYKEVLKYADEIRQDNLMIAITPNHYLCIGYNEDIEEDVCTLINVETTERLL